MGKIPTVRFFNGSINKYLNPANPLGNILATRLLNTRENTMELAGSRNREQ